MKQILVTKQVKSRAVGQFLGEQAAGALAGEALNQAINN